MKTLFLILALSLSSGLVYGQSKPIVDKLSGQKGHRHSNGGGFVSETATVAKTAYVGPKSRVLDGARVYEYARIENGSIVGGLSRVAGKARVENALVTHLASVRGNATVSRGAVVTEGLISGKSVVHGHVKFGKPKNKDTFCIQPPAMSPWHSVADWYKITDMSRPLGKGRPIMGKGVGAPSTGEPMHKKR